MRVESSVTAISWIPREAIEGMTKLPFEMGVFRYDDPPPDVIEDLDALHEQGAFREANELRGWIEIEDGRIVDHGQEGRALLGTTHLSLGPTQAGFPGIALPLLQPDPVITDASVTFTQSAGGRMALPAPRWVRRSPYFQIASSIAWSTLTLTIHADGRSEYQLAGASPFPRHYVYDASGRLMQRSTTIDFDGWYRGAFGKNTPWGETDHMPMVADIESDLERRLSEEVMGGRKLNIRRLEPGKTLVEQGDQGTDLFLVVDGVLGVEVDGEQLAEVGPGAILGERAQLEGGRRKATLRALTPVKAAVMPPDRVTREALEQVATGHRREEQR
jgi:hypothetical protein